MKALDESFRVIADITDSSLNDVMDKLAAEATRPAGFIVSVVAIYLMDRLSAFK